MHTDNRLQNVMDIKAQPGTFSPGGVWTLWSIGQHLSTHRQGLKYLGISRLHRSKGEYTISHYALNLWDSIRYLWHDIGYAIRVSIPVIHKAQVIANWAESSRSSTTQESARLLLSTLQVYLPFGSLRINVGSAYHQHQQTSKFVKYF